VEAFFLSRLLFGLVAFGVKSPPWEPTEVESPRRGGLRQDRASHRARQTATFQKLSFEIKSRVRPKGMFVSTPQPHAGSVNLHAEACD
jgi:hypothetical protein